MGKIVQTAGRNALGEFAPQFAHFNDDVLFGENWNNQDIDVKTRSIITVVALMSSGITDSSLKFHLQNAKDHGVTQKEIAAIITHTALYNLNAFHPANALRDVIGLNSSCINSSLSKLYFLGYVESSYLPSNRSGI